MKRQWDIEDLIEHFTLVEDDLKILANKTGTTRLGCALLLKCFQLEGRFPNAKHEQGFSQMRKRTHLDCKRTIKVSHCSPFSPNQGCSCPLLLLYSSENKGLSCCETLSRTDPEHAPSSCRAIALYPK